MTCTRKIDGLFLFESLIIYNFCTCMSVNFQTATQTKAQKDSLKYNRLYQLKVDVGMLNTVKNY